MIKGNVGSEPVVKANVLNKKINKGIVDNIKDIDRVYLSNTICRWKPSMFRYLYKYYWSKSWVVLNLIILLRVTITLRVSLITIASDN